ncbi:autotransporter assembly complex protein TamA [Albidovulum sp.]
MLLAASVLLLSPAAAPALDRLVLSAPAAPEDLRASLRASSLLIEAEAAGRTDAQNLVAAAKADYARLIGTLYAEGYYSSVISIRLDGREAAEIAPLDVPDRIDEVRIMVDPGPRFRFSAARMKPYARGTDLPPDYRDTLPAKSTAITAAAKAGIEGWRALGHAKAALADQVVIADHRTATVDSEILLDPGPLVRFGAVHMSGQKRMRLDRLAKIAGFPAGEVYHPDKIARVAKRLRDTGVFRSVAVTEAERLGPGDTLDVDIALVEEKPRRYGVGAEISTTEGLNLSGYWLHRNLLGGAERLRIGGEINRIGAAGNPIGYSLAIRLDRPATPVTDASAFLSLGARQTDLFDTTLHVGEIEFGLVRPFGDTLTAEAGLSWGAVQADYPWGARDYQRLALPLRLTSDRRDSPLDPVKGTYLAAGIAPFLGFGQTGSGARITADLRAYRAFGEKDRLVLAGRAQLGTIVGPSLIETPPDYLFFSGGGGTVRGQPYQSLGVPLTVGATTITTGGQSLAALSGEARMRITDAIGAVAFYDTAYVSDGEAWGGAGAWHAGAGIGLRYQTGIGPIRFDVAAPVSGATGNGIQFYLGIGQAF